MYAKLINGKLPPAPANLCKDSTVYQNYNLESNAAMLLADGYKPVAEMPAPDEMKKPKKYYVENENRITAVYVETYVEPDYRSKRAAEYPDFREYLDAVVKISSEDETMAAAGKTQLQTYCRLCLEIKQKYPKK